MRATRVLIAAFLSVGGSAWATTFTLNNLTGGSELVDFNCLTALTNGHFFAAGPLAQSPFKAYSVQFYGTGAQYDTPRSNEVEGTTIVGAIKSAAGDTIHLYVSTLNTTNGVARLDKVNKVNSRYAGSKALWDAAGPVHPLADGISISPTGDVSALFEVRPSGAGARIAVVLTVPLGNFSNAQVDNYPLGPGERILDCFPRPDGGLVFLTGTAASASTHVVSAAGTHTGPFFVGAASQVAYSPVSGGQVFTAGTAGPNAFFTRGPINGVFTDAKVQPFPFANLGFEFKTAFTCADGTCWWGGAFMTALSDTDGFICATKNSPGLDFFGATLAGNSPANEVVNAISVDPYGKGAWAGIGSLTVFNATTGATISRYPTVPNPNLKFRTVVNNPYVVDGDPFSNFGALVVNSSTQTTSFVNVSREGDLQKATTPLASYIGGTSPTLTVRLYKRKGSATSYALSSNASFVVAPATIAFGGSAQQKSISLTTRAVSTAQDVVITVGSGDTVEARFTLLPPTPHLFTPASLTVKGGQNVVSRLTLSGKTPVGGITIALSDNGSELSTDPTMFMPGGLYSKSFVIRTVPVVSTFTRIVTATYAGVSRTTGITINP